MAEAVAKRRPCMDITGLPRDVLIEILLRVGSIKDLFMFAVTCRQWLRHFTDPAFLRGLCPGQGEGHRARLLGFFFQQTRFVCCRRMVKMRMTEHTSTAAPTFMPVQGSPLGPVDRALTSFISDDDGTFNYAEPLAARRGIVLMYLLPRTFDLQRRATTTTHLLGLCNPITGERHIPPPLECPGSDSRVMRYAIITAADGDLHERQRPSSSGRFTFSQLFLIIQHEKSWQTFLHLYSATKHSWSPPTVCLNRGRFRFAGGRSAVVHQGAAHWLCIDQVASRGPRNDDQLYKLSAEVGTSRVSLTKLPLRGGGSPVLYVSSDGKLSVACLYPVHMTVWTQQSEDEGDDTPAPWLRTVIRKPMAMGPYTPCGEWFNFNRGSILVLLRNHGGVFVLDLQKKAMEKVMVCFPRQRDPCVSYVPYEMDLVEFFMLHLASLCRGSTG